MRLFFGLISERLLIKAIWWQLSLPFRVFGQRTTRERVGEVFRAHPQGWEEIGRSVSGGVGLPWPERKTVKRRRRRKKS